MCRAPFVPRLCAEPIPILSLVPSQFQFYTYDKNYNTYALCRALFDLRPCAKHIKTYALCRLTSKNETQTHAYLFIVPTHVIYHCILYIACAIFFSPSSHILFYTYCWPGGIQIGATLQRSQVFTYPSYLVTSYTHFPILHLTTKIHHQLRRRLAYTS